MPRLNFNLSLIAIRDYDVELRKKLDENKKE